jgi:hypothetical protein
MGEQVPEKKSRKLLYIVGGVLLLLVIIGVAAFAYDAWLTAQGERSRKQYQEAKERERKAKEPGGDFDSNDFQATTRWIAGQHVAMREAEDKKNELIAKEAKLTMLHTLAAVEGKPVQWQIGVEFVSANMLRLQPVYTFERGKDQFLVTIFVSDDTGKFSDGLAIGEKGTVTLEQASKLKAKDTVTLAGKVSRCYASQSREGWQFYVSIADAKIK